MMEEGSRKKGRKVLKFLVQEVSLVDSPANRRKFLLLKRHRGTEKDIQNLEFENPENSHKEVNPIMENALTAEEGARLVAEAARKAASDNLSPEEGEKLITQALLKYEESFKGKLVRKGGFPVSDSPDGGMKPGEILQKSSQNPQVQRVQQTADDLYIASALLGKPPQLLRKWEDYLRQVEELGKAMDTGTPGAGAEWIPTGFSPELVEKVRLQLKVASLHEHLSMPTDPFKLPRQTGFSTAYLKSENVAPPSSALGTGQASLDARTLAVFVPVSYELEEDSVFALLPVIKSDIVSALAAGIENATINGDDSASHMDSDVTEATDVRKAWKGYRKKALSGARIDFLGTLTVEKMRTLRGALGIYGVDPNDLAWVVSIGGYIQLLNLKDSAGNPVVLTVDKYGARATLLNGELGRLDGIPIIVSEYVREDLNANGVYDGITTNKTILALVYRRGFIYGNRRMAFIEAFRDIKTGTIEIVASQRIGFVDRLDASTQKIVGIGYNIASSV